VWYTETKYCIRFPFDKCDVNLGFSWHLAIFYTLAAQQRQGFFARPLGEHMGFARSQAALLTWTLRPLYNFRAVIFHLSVQIVSPLIQWCMLLLNITTKEQRCSLLRVWIFMWTLVECGQILLVLHFMWNYHT